MISWILIVGFSIAVFVGTRLFLASLRRNQIVHLATAMNTAVEQRCPFLRGTAQEVGALASKISTKLGSTESKAQEIRTIAMLCDVGVTSVPTSILAKEYEWSPHEQAVYDRHPETGGSILRGISPLREYAHIVERHHDRFESAQSNPIQSKILGIADDFVRCRRSMSQERSLLVIEKLSGTQYDPVVVSALRRVLVTHEA